MHVQYLSYEAVKGWPVDKRVSEGHSLRAKGKWKKDSNEEEWEEEWEEDSDEEEWGEGSDEEEWEEGFDEEGWEEEPDEEEWEEDSDEEEWASFYRPLLFFCPAPFPLPCLPYRFLFCFNINQFQLS